MYYYTTYLDYTQRRFAAVYGESHYGGRTTSR